MSVIYIVQAVSTLQKIPELASKVQSPVAQQLYKNMTEKKLQQVYASAINHMSDIKGSSICKL